MPHTMGNFRINDRSMRCSSFMARLYNLCISYGFTPGRIMPSRAFCSDESQGYPIILLAKHFGAFPFNHGQVGGTVATGRHAPHAHHGKDSMLLQASHVGYDPETKCFGRYRRMQMDRESFSTNCGKICGVIASYKQEYDLAKKSIAFSRVDGKEVVVIDNELLDTTRCCGLFLFLERLIVPGTNGKPEPIRVYSTSKAYQAAEELKKNVPQELFRENERQPIAERLTADLFFFRSDVEEKPKGQAQIERNLIHHMPQIVTSEHPPLTAAEVNTQVEFDRTYRTIITEQAYWGKNLLFVSGVHIDISPNEDQLFPLTKFVPWAAYVQTSDGRQFLLEQDELWEALCAQSKENPDKIDLEDAIDAMKGIPELKIEL